jgi:hypothetical protein
MSVTTLAPASASVPARRDILNGCPRRLDRRVVIVRPFHHLRPQVEACISDVYARAFGARGLVFPRRLIALLDDAGRPICAAGLRTPAEEFFSEIYLDSPIDELLRAAIGRPVHRCQIFEITTLASRSAEISPLFIRQLALLGKIAGFEWSFFTATARLRLLLSQLGIPFTQLEAADPARLANADSWGRYYTQAPIVCAVNRRWLDGCVSKPREEALGDA